MSCRSQSTIYNFNVCIDYLLYTLSILIDEKPISISLLFSIYGAMREFWQVTNFAIFPMYLWNYEEALTYGIPKGDGLIFLFYDDIFILWRRLGKYKNFNLLQRLLG